MTVRDLLHLNKNVPVTRGSNPIVAFQDEVNKLFSDFFGETNLPGWMRGTQAAVSISPANDI